MCTALVTVEHLTIFVTAFFVSVSQNIFLIVCIMLRC